MATQLLPNIYTGGGFSVAATGILTTPAVDGTITDVYLDAKTNSVGDALFSLKLDGAEIVAPTSFKIVNGTQNVNVAGLSIAMTKGSLLTLDLVTPLPTTMPEPPYSLIITYDDGTVIDVAGAIHAATGKTTPVDADELGIADSAASFALKKLTWANLKATLKTYLDTLYQPLNSILTAFVGLSPSNDDFLQRKAGAWTNRTVAQVKTDLSLTGTNSGDETVSTLGATINGATAATPNNADLVATVDTSVVKKITWTNVKAFLKTYFDTLYPSGSGTSSGTNTGDQTITLTGDVTGSGTGSFAATIASLAVTYAKMQNVSATSRILGRKTAGAGSTEECTLSDILDFIGSAAQGDILYRGASGWARLGAGTSGNFLKTQGAAANPVWAAVPGGGDLLSTNNLSDLANAGTARTNLGLGTIATKDGTGFSKISVGTSTPATPSVGDLWIDTN